MSFFEVETTDHQVRVNAANISHFVAGSNGKAAIVMMNGKELKTTQTVQSVSERISNLAKKAEIA
ncbi:hypothetical protein K3718_21400 (plasmid) [Leisingera aquaemixtae]|uniref:Uncharacterized protein n=1 Tax=Leisingera aquaemixtae TaxID=1396826 RepID=A0ABY5WRH0_9RHOB|nr:hypothetical protein [Leisingera aquaemixtae]UWQ44051.1 hypothetical protein K3718_21400 [Leisingera aquaemixtae]